MPEAIRDRRPTEADADCDGMVEVWDGNKWSRRYIENANHIWWRPIDQTPPPEPERRQFFRSSDGAFSQLKHYTDDTLYLEVLPGDPPDLDAFIEQAVRIFELTNPLIELDERELGIARMRFDKARHGEGGEG